MNAKSALSSLAPEPTPASTAASSPSRPRTWLRHVPAVERVLLGLMFTFFGLDGFLHFIPQPEAPISEGAVAFGGALMKTGYMFPLIKGTELLVGLLLLTNRFVPLALVVLASVLVNIIAFNLFLAPTGLGVCAVILALHLHLAWHHRAAYRPLLAPRAMRS